MCEVGGTREVVQLIEAGLSTVHAVNVLAIRSTIVLEAAGTVCRKKCDRSTVPPTVKGAFFGCKGGFFRLARSQVTSYADPHPRQQALSKLNDYDRTPLLVVPEYNTGNCVQPPG